MMSMGSHLGHVGGVVGLELQPTGMQAELLALRLLGGASGETSREQRRTLARRLLEAMASGDATEVERPNASTRRLQSMGQMSPKGLRGLLLGIPQERLNRLVLDSLGSQGESRGQGKQRFDTTGIDALLAGIFRVDCSEARSFVFQTMVCAQDVMEGYPAAVVLSRQLISLLLQDTAGIFAALQWHDPEAHSLIAFLKAMFANKSPEARDLLKELVIALMHGPQGESLSAYMSHGTSLASTATRQSHEEQFQGFTNAAHLGYFAGATQVALSAVVIHSREQAAILNNVFLGALKAKGGVTGRTTSQKANSELERLGFYYIISEIDKGDLALLDGLYNLAYPRTPQGRPMPNQEGPGLSFKESFDHIVLSHQR